MRPILQVLISACVMTLALGAQPAAGAPSACSKNVESISQLPLEPNEVLLHFPTSLCSVAGIWRAISSDGTVKEQSCGKGEKGLCVSISGYDPANPCISGTIDLARHIQLMKPGTYSLEWVSKESPERFGPLTLTIKEPVGIDKEAYEKVLLACLKEHDARRGGKGNLMGWSFFCLESPHFLKILELYPTSTYAGYGLMSMPTGTTPIRWSLSCLQDPDETLRKDCDRNGGEANTQAHLEIARKDLAAYAKKAAAFLQAHPGFTHSQEIRHAYAMSLGLTGHLSEALAEVEILAKGQGNLADDARAFLKLRQAGKGPNGAGETMPTCPAKEPIAPTPEAKRKDGQP